MKKIELTLGGMFVAGRIFAILQIPGYAILTVFSALPLVFMYFLLSYYLLNSKTWRDIFRKETYSQIKAYPAVMSVLAGSFALSSFVAAVLMTVMHYTPNLVLFYSMTVFLVLFFITLIVSFLRDKHKQFSKRNLIRIGIVLFLGIVAVVLS